jgi:hypothetical protein
MTKVNDNLAGSEAEQGRKYAAFAHSFHDPWEGTDEEFSFRFAQPTKTQIKRLTDTGSKNTMQASRDLLLGTIHPDDREKLLATLEEYPGLALSFSTGLIKTVGITADLGN